MASETKSEPQSQSSHALFPDEIETSQITRKDQLFRLFDLYIYAPLAVMWHNWRAKVGSAIILFFIGVGTIGVSLVSQPTLNEFEPYVTWFQAMEAPLGTDRSGRSIAKQLVHATPAMLKMALAGAIFATGVALIVGVTSGYRGGQIDRVLMTLTDIMICIPGLPLVIVLAAIYEPKDPFIVGIILAIDRWPGLARAIRSQALTIREEAYVEAARTMGTNWSGILRKDVTPQLMPYVLINAAQTSRAVIFESVALYFLGILPFTTFNWGVMMNLAHEQGGALANLPRAGHWLFAPMIALILLSFGLVLFAQGMDSVFNPSLRARHAKTIETEDGDGASSHG